MSTEHVQKKKQGPYFEVSATQAYPKAQCKILVFRMLSST